MSDIWGAPPEKLQLTPLEMLRWKSKYFDFKIEKTAGNPI